MKNVGRLILVVFAVSAFLAFGPVYADEGKAKKSPWEFTFMPYVSTVGVNGTVGADHVSGHVNVPWHKLKNYVKTGYAAYFEARNDRHAAYFNGSYLKLEDDGTLRDARIAAYADITLQISNMEFGYSYRLAKQKAYTFDLFAGARYWRFRTDLDVAVPIVGFQNSYHDTEQWIDPIIGFVFTPALTEKLSLILRGDMGGFGVGTHFTWKGMAAFNYQLTKKVGAQVGYNCTYLDYSRGGFTADVYLQGAFAGLSYKF